MGGKGKHPHLFNLFQMYNIDMLVILEHKAKRGRIHRFAADIGMTQWVSGDINIHIWILWSNRIDIVMLKEHQQFITVHVTDIRNGDKHLFSVVYASNKR